MEKFAQGAFWRRMAGDFPGHDALEFKENSRGPDGFTYALILAYDGSPFLGFQVQPKGLTIQGELEKCLSKLCNESIRVFASGRTDAGVHALGQVVSFTTSSDLSCERMLKGLRAMLPSEIKPRDLARVKSDFHARFDALAKTYEYYLWPSSHLQSHIFLKNRLWDLNRHLDPKPVVQALDYLIGDHDLMAMTSQGCEVKGSTVRRILKTDLEVDQLGIWRIRFTATGFLRHVVRNLVGTLAQIGWGKLKPGDLGEMLQAGVRFHPGPKAPAWGLYLNRVYYKPFTPNILGNNEKK